MPSARRASADDVAGIAATFGSAFREDPVFQWMTGVDDTATRMARFWRKDVGLVLQHGDNLVYVTDDFASAAVWRDIRKWKTSAWESLALAPASVGAFRFRLPRCIGLLRAMEKAHPTEPHYYLESLGTRADHQGKGAGSAVLRPMLERCDAEGLPAYLESSNPRNVPFYARHGFTERGLLRTPEGAPPMMTMWREPRS